MENGARPGPLDLHQIFPGESELARLMRAFDWSKTDLGSPEAWPQTLRVAVSICITSRFPILLWWGPNFTVLYNDAYIPFLGESKHPRFLGAAGRECWAEIWDVICPMLEGVRATGQATWSDAFPFFFARKLPREEVHVRFTYGPILASDGRTVEGIFTPCTEITDEVIGARRLETLRKLSEHTAGARTIGAACRASMHVLAENPEDIPFAAIYVADAEGAEARLEAAVYPEGDHRFPDQATLAGPGSPWPLGSVLGGAGPTVVQLDDLGLELSGVRWPDPIRTALLLPVSAAQNRLLGILVLGTSSRRPLDASYRTFFDLACRHVATALADALGYEEERRRAEGLAELDRVKTAFFSNISHEFRTPLTLMLGPLDELQKRATESVVVPHGDLNLIHRNAHRLLRLVNSLLDFSRIEAGRIEASYEPTDLAPLTTELANIFQSAADKAGLRLTVACPPLAEPVYVDRAMWEKIVLNLVSNAFKFTFEGEVAVSMAQSGSSVELSVSDTGIGISEEDLPRLFDRFYQVKGALGRTHEGSGIGLALINDLVKLHGGTVRVESILGKGSRFTVSIPMGLAHLPAEQVRSPRQPPVSVAVAFADEANLWMENVAAPSAKQTSAQALRRSRILIADDNADMRSYLRRVLAGTYEVDEAVDGEAALATALNRPPDLVVADVMMPRMDGFALLGALRRSPATSRLPIILLSARAGEESQAEGLLAGADDYLAKPFSAQELLSRISARLELARVHRDAAEREHFIEQIAELTPVVISVYDVASKRDVYISRDVAGLMGYTREEILARTDVLGALAHPDDLSRNCQKLARLTTLADGEICEMEYRLRRRDGEWRWLSSRAMPFARSENGDVRQVIAATVDVTARKQADEALRSSEERFRRIFDLGLIGLAITSPEKGILAVNDEICRILGYNRAELLQKTWAELTHPDDLAADVAYFDAVMAGEIDGYSVDKRWIRKDGQVIDSTISARCVRRVDQTVDYFMAFLQDITARKQAEAALARSHSELERRVAERTAEITAINEALTVEIAERKRAEAESVAAKDALAAELAAMTGLHEFSTRLLQRTELKPLLEEVLSAIITIQEADFGNIQLYNSETRSLEIVAQRGFEQPFLDYFSNVHSGEAACGRALQQRERIIIEDVLADAGFAPHRPVAAAAGFRAVQSTPLFSRGGDSLGMISTHFRRPHRPSHRDLRFTDLYGRLAVELVERQRAEDALRASEGRFRALVQDLPAGVYICDAASHITYFNEAAAGLWGRRPELQREQWCGSLRTFQPNGDPVALEECPMALALIGKGTASGEELIFERPDGSRRNVMVYPEAIRDPAGTVTGAVNMLWDITEYKAAQRALQRSEDRFRRYFELGLVGMAITSPEKAILEVNDEICRILGYERSELLQKTWPELSHPDDLPADIAQFHRVMAGEIDGYTLDKRWIRKDGQIVESIVSAKCLRRPDGSVDYFMKLLQDITGRKRVERKLQRSEAYLAEGQRISHTGSWAVKLPTWEIFWSEEMFHIYGLDPDRAVLSQSQVFELIHSDDRASVEEVFDRAINHKTDYDVEHRAILPDGSLKYLHALGHPILNEAGEVLEYVGTVADITERKRAEQALQKLQSELQQVARVTMMGELAAAIAHEINQPLGAIVNNSSVALKLAAEETTSARKELRDVLPDIVADSSRASGILARMRGLMKRVAPSKEPLAINDIIRDVLALAGRELAERRITVRLEVAEHLPQVLGDRVQFQQVFLNLVMNAAEAMSEMPDARRILSISGRESDRNGRPVVLVTVRDFGWGLAVEDPERLFEALYTTKADGMGMGLRISRSIAEAHGGNLWAQPNEDIGATFFFSLPALATTL